eukprot:g7360.t1
MISCSRHGHRSCFALIFPDSNNPDRPGPKRPPGRLINPNENQRGVSRSGPRLFVPGQSTTGPSTHPSNTGGGGGGLITESDSVMNGSPETRRSYHPPMGYFAKQKTVDAELNIEAETMLQRLKAGTGLWHVLAQYLPRLNDQGYDSTVIEAMTGITKAEQSILAIASSVFQSIVSHIEQKKPNYSTVDQISEFFDIEGTHFSLYELRFLDIEERAMCAAYVAQQRLDAKDSQDLARSTKEYIRRKSETDGFEPAPADILAFKYYRNAIESREESLIDSFVKQGVDIAQSEAAKDKLRQLLTGHDKILETKQTTKKARIEMYRMLTTDLLFRPIPFAGDITKVDCGMFENAPWATQSGEFGVFAIHKEDPKVSEKGWKWMALPNWPLLSKSRRPISLAIRNCAKVEAILQSAKAKTENEIKRLSGPGMLVFDLTDKTVVPSEYYIARGDDNLLVIKDGEELAGGTEDNVLGKVLLLCRPPDKQSIDSFES